MAGRRTAFRRGEYYFGSDQFDNTEQAGFAELETVAVLNGENGDLVSTETNTVFIAAATDPYLYDDDGNQLRVSTTTGSWQITYNGENRPVEWTDGDRVLLMTYDHKGRRRMYAETRNGATNILHRFTYDDYLCIARNREIDVAYGGGAECFIWDPTEPVATRPLMCNPSTAPPLLYCHDGNKNVSDMVTMDGTVAAHYEYSSFGKVVMAASNLQLNGCPMHILNPYRFSSEYHDDALGLVYYNYRHYNPGDGRWIGRDPIENLALNLYCMVDNNTILKFDSLGWFWSDYIPIVNTFHMLFDFIFGNFEGVNVGDYPTINKDDCECNSVKAEEECRKNVRDFVGMYTANQLSSLVKAKGAEFAVAAASTWANPYLSAIAFGDSFAGAALALAVNSKIMEASSAAMMACRCD